MNVSYPWQATVQEALDELARAARYEVLVLLDRGGAHAAPPVLAPPQVRVRVEDPDHGQRLVREHAPDEVCTSTREVSKGREGERGADMTYGALWARRRDREGR